ncbi:hypothetical protein GCM10022222_10450 [Amycolatopsis ultiminotia]|uniref:Uncharacterized protein n=1 Tax=Amycolatopsis ultiminotia TaxID=543629 RepID=A0ABP6V9K4_9PSEU
MVARHGVDGMSDMCTQALLPCGTGRRSPGAPGNRTGRVAAGARHVVAGQFAAGQ